MKRYFGIEAGKRRSGWIGALILGAFGLVLVRLFWLQIFSGDELARKAFEQTAGVEKVYSPRGSIPIVTVRNLLSASCVSHCMVTP